MSQRTKAFQLSDVGLSQGLPREGRRLQRERLRRPRVLATQIRRGDGALLNGKEWLPRLAIEQEHEPALRDLRDCVDARWMACQCDQVGRGRKIAVPQVVMHGLEMPQPLPRPGVEGKERIREEVGAEPRAAVEVGRRRSGRDVDNAATHVEGHAGPRVGTACRLPGGGGPGLVAEFSGVRDRMKCPANRSAAHVVRAYVPRRRAFVFADARALNEKIAVDGTRRRRDEVGIADVAGQAGAEVYGSGVTEGGNGVTGARVERVQPASRGKEDSSIVAACPIDDTAIDMGRGSAWVELPDQCAGARAQCDDRQRRRRRVEDPGDDDRRRLNFSMTIGWQVAGVVGPGDAQLRDITRIDLVERGVARVARFAARDPPVVR